MLGYRRYALREDRMATKTDASPTPHNVMVRGVPDDLWHEAHIAATAKRQRISTWVIEAIRGALKK